MAYRAYEPKCPPKHRNAQNLSTPARFYIVNGSIFELALPCWYHEILPSIPARHHCRDWHDHVGNPDPMHSDHVCQDHDYAIHVDAHRIDRYCRTALNLKNLFPIHLREEGYETVEVAFDPPIDGLEAQGKIDQSDDWVLRITIKAEVSEPQDEHKPFQQLTAPLHPVRTRMAVRVYNSERSICDVAAIAELIITPAAR